MPGKYECRVDGYGGFIQFPYPFTLAHFEAWWSLAVKPQKGKTRTEINLFVDDWPAARELLRKYGDWRVEGVTLGQLESDDVPLEIVSWVVDCADEYISPLLSQKKRLLLSIATWLER
jgi:hypothetical protein